LEIIKNIYNEYTNLINNFFENRSKETIKNNSQYFTPFNEADKLLEDLPVIEKKSIRILDPAVGCGILLIKLLEKILTSNYIPKSIVIDIYDTDKEALNIAETLLRKLTLEYKNIVINSYSNDFLDEDIQHKYDYIVQNPPYKKITQKDVSKELLNFVNGQPNLYHMFIAKSLLLLEENGTLCILSPKNFLSGRYTEPLRKYIFDNFSITKIHTFDDRRNIFESGVIQEVCITHISKRQKETIKISHNGSFEKVVRYDQIVLDNETKIVLTPHSNNDLSNYEKFQIFPFGIKENSIIMKTGIVVQFRVDDRFTNLKEHEFSTYENGIPLIVYRHINTENFNYRYLNDKLKNKAITLMKTEKTQSLLIPNNNYVFIRKSTDKKYDKLLQSVVYHHEMTSEYIALDNSIAYFTNENHSLSELETMGIHCVLKSTQFDNYYRMLNSSHAINTYELENMHFPDLETLRIIGEQFRTTNRTNESATRIMEEILQ